MLRRGHRRRRGGGRGDGRRGRVRGGGRGGGLGGLGRGSAARRLLAPAPGRRPGRAWRRSPRPGPSGRRARRTGPGAWRCNSRSCLCSARVASCSFWYTSSSCSLTRSMRCARRAVSSVSLPSTSVASCVPDDVYASAARARTAARAVLARASRSSRSCSLRAMSSSSDDTRSSAVKYFDDSASACARRSLALLVVCASANGANAVPRMAHSATSTPTTSAREPDWRTSGIPPR